MILGRERELALIDDMLERARSQRGGGLCLRGEPGMGKTTLLDYAVQSAASFRVLRGIGVDAESRFAYATLHQLLLPVLDRIDCLPAPQRDALRNAFGSAPARAIQPFLISVATLTLLSEIGGEQPVLCVVDDAQWSDAASLEIFAFVARRLEAEPVAMLLALRDAEGRDVDTAGITDLRLEGLDHASATALLAGRVAPALLEAFVRNTGGNPLALIELPEGLDGSGLTPHDAVHEPLPVAGRLERVFLDRARRLGPDAFTVLLLAAAAGAASTGSIIRAAQHLGIDAEFIDSPHMSDFLLVTDGVVTFGHPLVRSAVYHGATVRGRRAAHLALARALACDPSQADRQAWHRANATEGTDDTVAIDLEHAATQALHRSGHLAAAATLERSAELSSGDEDRARRLVGAARAAWHGGGTSAALALLDRVDDLRPSDPLVRLAARYLRGSIELRTGSPAEAVAILVPAAEAAVDVDPGLALQLLLVAREASYTAVDSDALVPLAQTFARLPRPRRHHDRLIADALDLYIHPTADRDRAVAVITQLTQLEQLDEPELLLTTGGMAWGVGEFALATRFRRRAVARARSLGAAGTLALTLEYVVPEEISQGRYASAEALADEGYRLARETGRPNSASLHLAFLGMIAGTRGREAEARQLAEQAMSEAMSRRLVKVADIAQRTLGLLALANQRPDDALVIFGKLDGSGPEPGSRVIAITAIPDHIEAAVRTGAMSTARRLFARYREWVEGIGTAELLALVARSRALLADAEEAADAAFAEASRLHATTDCPFDHARTELLHGEFLRRARHRSSARAHLRSAMETFDRLGAPIWAERARVELRATGESVRPRTPSDTVEMTPQELRVAQAVRLGATNREVAAQLFVSPRTVDYHLRKVFRKLGITSRRELMRLDLGRVPKS